MGQPLWQQPGYRRAAHGGVEAGVVAAAAAEAGVVAAAVTVLLIELSSAQGNQG